MADLSHAARIIRGLTLLVAHGATDCDFDHDVIYCGPSQQLQNLPADVKAELEDLGWFWGSDVGAWQHF